MLWNFRWKESNVGCYWGGLWVEFWGLSKIWLEKVKKGSENSESEGEEIREYDIYV